MNCYRWLLRAGYFPKELPPAFSTTRFSVALTKSVRNGTAIPPSGKKSAEMMCHSLARAGGVRRVLGIPNPIFFASLAKEIADNWGYLRRKARLSPISLSAPVLSASGRSIRPMGALAQLPQMRLERRIGGRYLLCADLSEFYKSIYTHSIPWALHTRDVAKNDRSDALLGNRLDKAIRNCQDTQTNGIPIGPDTSFLLAELILAHLDSVIFDKSTYLSAHRYYDDYEISFEKIGQAEEMLAKMQASFAVFGLQLNPTKTKILDLPQPLDDSVSAKVKNFDLKRSGMARIHWLFQFFDYLLTEKAKSPTSHFYSYAIPQLIQQEWSGEEWKAAQKVAFHLAEAEPSAVQTLVVEILSAQEKGRALDRSMYEPCLNRIATRCALAGHGHEVVWAVWAAVQMKYAISNDTVKAVSQMDDPFVALVMLHADSEGLIAGGLSSDRWRLAMDQEGLYGEQSILAYEACVKGWAESSTDYVAPDPYFSFLRTNKVTFYEHKLRLDERRIRRFRSTQRSGYEHVYDDDGDEFSDFDAESNDS